MGSNDNLIALPPKLPPPPHRKKIWHSSKMASPNSKSSISTIYWKIGDCEQSIFSLIEMITGSVKPC